MTIRNISDAAKRNARMSAAARGRSLEAELRNLVERTYVAPADDRAARIRSMSGEEFVRHLIHVANGADLRVPPREAEAIDFPTL